jgi:hypothetical protein
MNFLGDVKNRIFVHQQYNPLLKEKHYSSISVDYSFWTTFVTVPDRVTCLTRLERRILLATPISFID